MQDEENRALASWVSNQRTQYRNKTEKRKASINQNRINLLESINFAWKVNPNGKKTKKRSDDMNKTTAATNVAKKPRTESLGNKNPVPSKTSSVISFTYSDLTETIQSDQNGNINNLVCLERNEPTQNIIRCEESFDFLNSNTCMGAVSTGTGTGNLPKSKVDVTLLDSNGVRSTAANISRDKAMSLDQSSDDSERFFFNAVTAPNISSECLSTKQGQSIPSIFLMSGLNTDNQQTNVFHTADSSINGEKHPPVAPAPFIFEKDTPPAELKHSLSQCKHLHGQKDTGDEMDWDVMFEMLVKYKNEHGDTLVPKDYNRAPHLSKWVNSQRQFYRFLLNGGKSCSQARERIKKLQRIGFTWCEVDKKHWDDMYNQLKAYKRKYGSCMVPVKCDTNPNLGSWVSNQRRNYRAYTENRPSPLNETMIQQLKDIDFVFDVRNFSQTFVTQMTDDSYWNQMVTLLKKFRDDEGHCLITPTSTACAQLKTFSSALRKEYRRIKGDTTTFVAPTFLTDERVALLDEMGFLFDVGSGKKHEQWMENYKKYKSQHGKRLSDCDAAETLQKWAKDQRSMYSRLLKGLKSSLTSERIILLDEIGFQWTENDCYSTPNDLNNNGRYKRNKGSVEKLVTKNSNAEMTVGMRTDNSHEGDYLSEANEKRSSVVGDLDSAIDSDKPNKYKCRDNTIKDDGNEEKCTKGTVEMTAI